MSDCTPVFYMRPVKNNFRSNKEGRPIYEDKEFVQILIPGSKNEAPDRPVNNQDRDRWPKEYERFLAKKERAQEGTPLEAWPQMTPSQVAELKDLNIFSVDQLASLPDSQITNLGPGGQTLKQKAKQFLESAGGTKAFGDAEEIRSENEALKVRIEALEAENAELAKNQRKKPGRKSVAEEAPLEESL